MNSVLKTCQKKLSPRPATRVLHGTNRGQSPLWSSDLSDHDNRGVFVFTTPLNTRSEHEEGKVDELHLFSRIAVVLAYVVAEDDGHAIRRIISIDHFLSTQISHSVVVKNYESRESWFLAGHIYFLLYEFYKKGDCPILTSSGIAIKAYFVT